MDSSTRLLPVIVLGLLLPLSGCVSAPRTPSATSPNALRYCDPYAINSSAFGSCSNGINRFDYVGYGGYYGGYGYPQDYGAASPIYGAYGFNRGRGGFGSYYFNDGYHFANAYSHGHSGIGYVPVSYSRPLLVGHFGQGRGHFGSYGGRHEDIVSHSGSPRHTSGTRHRGSAGHSRSSHHGGGHR